MRATGLAFVYIQYPTSQIYKIIPKNEGIEYNNYTAYDPTYQSNRGSLFKKIETQPPFLIPKGKALRTDEAGRILLLSWGKGIRIIFNITRENNGENEGDLVQFDQSDIDEFRILGADRSGDDPVGVLSACSNMVLYYHQIQKNKGNNFSLNFKGVEYYLNVISE